jgi:hypothetical protein
MAHRDLPADRHGVAPPSRFRLVVVALLFASGCALVAAQDPEAELERQNRFLTKRADIHEAFFSPRCTLIWWLSRRESSMTA